MMNKLIRFIKDADYRFLTLNHRGFYKSMSDEAVMKRAFKAYFGRELNLEDPKTMNEKLQWLKLHDRKPEYTTMVDKYAAKKYIAERIGEEHIIPTLGVWDRFADIDFDSLPDQFVLKTTHDSGNVIVCRDKAKLDKKKAKKKLNKSLKRNFYWWGREWPYKNVKPRIIAEKYMANSAEEDEFTDYKFYCFNGYVDCVLCCYERSSGEPKFYFFDRDWNLKRYNKRGKEAPEDFTKPKPDNIDEMFAIAEKLSADVGAPFLRVDLYSSYGQIYFGELTFYPSSGFDLNRLPETDLVFGNLINLKR